MNNKEFLPIGSVVDLNGGIKKLMVTGFLPITKDGKESYDYCGCLYPEGIITSETNFLFNHDQIQNIYFKGYVDKEEEVYKEKLAKLVENLNKK